MGQQLDREAVYSHLRLIISPLRSSTISLGCNNLAIKLSYWAVFRTVAVAKKSH